MKKAKILALLLAAMMLVVVTGACATASPTPSGAGAPTEGATDGATEGEPSGDGTFELALITDVGTIDDKSFNQGSWEGLERYAKEHNITHKYYQPTEKSKDSYITAIEMAVEAGAKLIVTPGFLFETAIFEAQESHPDVKFVLLDGVPNDGNPDFAERVFKVADNTVAVSYAEHESGFLAGYAAVREGFTSLGFMGGMAVPPVVRFGYGFLQGAEYAAADMGLDGIDVRYHYTGNFDANPTNQALASAWYNDGVEVIFAAGGAVGNSVMTAAETADAKVIGVDIDQSGESETVITSALKELGNSVYDSIAMFYADEFPGGLCKVFSAENYGVGLPQDFSRFDTFAQAAYDAIFAKLKDGEVEVNDTIAEDLAELGLNIVNVTKID